MRFTRLTVLFVAAAAVFATECTEPVDCSTGIQCCNTVRGAGPTDLTQIFGLLGLVVPLGTQIGLTCTSLSVLQALGQTCGGNTVCCKNVASDGSIAVGCINVIV